MIVKPVKPVKREKLNKKTGSLENHEMVKFSSKSRKGIDLVYPELVIEQKKIISLKKKNSTLF